jgi:hypothetical protein
VVWTNGEKGFGFAPADSSASADVDRAIASFKTLAEVGGQQSLSASVVYAAAKQLEGFGLENESQGPLRGALDTLTELNTPVTAAALPEGSPTIPAGDSLCATVDEAENVLELIYSNADGIYVRDDGQWVLLDTSVDQPTVDDQEWLDVTPAFVPVFDQLIATSDSIPRSEAAKYAAPQV